MKLRLWMLLAQAGLLGSLLTPNEAVAQQRDANLQALQEARLRPGQLPAWETLQERAWRHGPTAPQAWSGIPMPPPTTPYRVPAEFERVSAFLVTQGDWNASGSMPEIAMLFDMVREGTADQGAGAIVLTYDTPESMLATLVSKGVTASRVRVLKPPQGLDAKWARDFGPISVYQQAVDGHLGFLDLHYYDSRSHDDAVVGYLADLLGIARFGLEGDDHTPPDAAKLYMEGGNFQTDGQGTCILSNDIPADNADHGNTQADTLEEVEQILKAYANCQKFVWLTPLPHNSTGHVDMDSKLLTPTDILMIDFPNATGNNGQADAVVEQNVAAVSAATNLNGQPFQVHRVTIPSVDSFWTYRTYTNSVIVNKIALVPAYDDATLDQAALDAYASILGASYKVVGIRASDIVDQGGAVHCTTMQIASACGDGVVEHVLFEECDGADLAGQTCALLGLSPGVLACDPSTCQFDVSQCNGAVADAGDDGPAEASADVMEEQTGADASSPESSVSESGPQEAGAGDSVAGDASREASPEPSGADAGEAGDGSPAWRDEPIAAADQGSCGCRQGSTDSGYGFWWLALGVLAARRRRRV